MCMVCVAEYAEAEGIGGLEIPDELMPLVRRITAFYEMTGCGCGGPLHIVLDDTNIGDESINWCLQQDHDGYDAAVWAETEAIARGLLEIASPTMRALVTVAA